MSRRVRMFLVSWVLFGSIELEFRHRKVKKVLSIQDVEI